jgi:hypothetical protein
VTDRDGLDRLGPRGGGGGAGGPPPPPPPPGLSRIEKISCGIVLPGV